MPGLRENVLERINRELVIDSELSVLIPPLTPDEFTKLEDSILTEGCRDAIIVWGNVIVDGHNRYKICAKHGIPFRTEPRDFPNKQAVIIWMLQNQLARRNLTDFQRIEIVRKFEDSIKAQAKQRQLSGLVQNNSTVLPNRARKDSRDELAQMAGVGHTTYERAATVLDEAPEEIIQAAREGTISIHKAYTAIKPPKPQKTYWDSLIHHAEKTAHDRKNIDAVIALLNQAIEILTAAQHS